MCARRSFASAAAVRAAARHRLSGAPEKDVPNRRTGTKRAIAWLLAYASVHPIFIGPVETGAPGKVWYNLADLPAG